MLHVLRRISKQPQLPKIAHAEILRHDDPRSPQLGLPLLQTSQKSHSQLVTTSTTSRQDSTTTITGTGRFHTSLLLPESADSISIPACGRIPGTLQTTPTRSGWLLPPPLTPRWWWLDPNISRRDYHLRHRASIGHRHGRDPPHPPSAENPSQSCYEALPFGHVSSHHLIDLETKSVTDDTKCSIPTTRLQPKLPT